MIPINFVLKYIIIFRIFSISGKYLLVQISEPPKGKSRQLAATLAQAGIAIGQAIFCKGQARQLAAVLAQERTLGDLEGLGKTLFCSGPTQPAQGGPTQPTQGGPTQPTQGGPIQPPQGQSRQLAGTLAQAGIAIGQAIFCKGQSRQLAAAIAQERSLGGGLGGLGKALFC